MTGAPPHSRPGILHWIAVLLKASAGELTDVKLQSSGAPLHSKIPAYSIPLMKYRVPEQVLEHLMLSS